MTGKMEQASALVWLILSSQNTARGQHQPCRSTPPQVPVDAGRSLQKHPTAPWWDAAPQGTDVRKIPGESLGNASWLQAGTSDLLNKNVFSTDCEYITQNLVQKIILCCPLSNAADHLSRNVCNNFLVQLQKTSTFSFKICNVLKLNFYCCWKSTEV